MVLLSASGKYAPVENAQDAWVFVIAFLIILLGLALYFRNRRR